MSLDVRRAFDQVPHNALLTSLQRRGVPEPLLRLFRSYLKDRTHFVRVGEASSWHVPVASGVPQGSVLGGYSFVAYVDPILHLQLSPGAQVLMFADDLILVKPIPTPEAEFELCQDVVTIEHEVDNLFLQLTAAKCQYMVCSLAPAVPPDLQHAPVLQGENLQRLETLKYLGAMLDRRLAFDIDTKTTATKAKRVVGALHHAIGRFAGNERSKALYIAKVLPILTYAITVTFPGYQKDWSIIEKVNRYTCRLLCNDFRSSYINLLAKMQLHSIGQIAFVRGQLLLFKYVNEFRHLPGGVLQ